MDLTQNFTDWCFNMQELHQKLPLLLEYSEILINDTIKFENMLIYVQWLIF